MSLGAVAWLWILKAIEEQTAGGKIKKVEKATEGKKVYYEAEFIKGGKEHEVKIAPDGKIIAVDTERSSLLEVLESYERDEEVT